MLIYLIFVWKKNDVSFKIVYEISGSHSAQPVSITITQISWLHFGIQGSFGNIFGIVSFERNASWFLHFRQAVYANLFHVQGVF